jgi:multiple sugar transport system ATP-binding protein
MATLTVRGLTKRFPDGDLAVDAVDLTVGDGELFVLVGPSGSGKTTLLRMIAGLEPPTAGDVVIGGVRVNDLTPRQRDIAMTFQGGALYPNMTVADNLAFPLKALGVDHREIERRVGDVAALLHVDELLDQRPRRLSGGQRQRVAMGRAIIRHPRLFLMDEPLSHLDSRLRVETRSVIVALQRRLGVTTIYVTHDQAEAMSMADRVAVMRDGHVVQIGAPMELYHDPVDLFVATFLGLPPMSVVHAEPGERAGVPGLRIGAQWLPWPALHDLHPSITRRHPGTLAVGFRSEALTLDDGGSLAMTVAAIEELGHERLLFGTLVAEPVRAAPAGGAESADEAIAVLAVAVRAPASIDLWKPVRVAVDTSLVHLFDLTTGRTLVPAATPVAHDRTSC